ncbi:septum formation protein Maf [Glaciecola sp. XM2]|uniref:Maf family protein n=1 Tax=Glaciecola sp. XM2 TaxID=1914931 RepID=UPI001BDDE7B7|nr:Maf family protein [Glaciecola sp. XM2]MBT1449547.1 septum formation protein Maf [Glaciecola sp. XM2]
MNTDTPKFLLASSSPYRAAMLRQLGIAFDVASPNIDESPLCTELPAHLALRLSQQKAQSLVSNYAEHIIIASDQVACIAGTHAPLGKPLSITNAIAQLTRCSGRVVDFYTGLSVILPDSICAPRQCEKQHTLVEKFSVEFRTLSHAQIEAYVHAEQPLDCAGSFKAEGLGIALFQGFSGRDYNTLIGLPLMALVDTLNRFGIDVLQSATYQQQ